MSSKTRRPVWAVLRGDILEHFLALTPGAPEGNLLAVFWLNLQEKEKRERAKRKREGFGKRYDSIWSEPSHGE